MKEKNVPKLRFKGFSDEWEEKRMSSICTINQGLQIAISDRFTDYKEGRYFYITNEFLRSDSDKKYYIENPVESVKCTEEDILMTRTGNTGKVVTNVSGAFHNNFFKINYNKERVNKTFLCQFLTSYKTQKNILRLAGTSTIPDLNHSDFYNIKINMPAIEEQERIANFLTKVDKIIEKQEEKVSNLEQYKKGMMQKIFSQEIRFKKDDGSEYPEWKEKRASELFKNISDKNHNGELEVLSVTQDRGVMLRNELDIDIKFDLESVKNYKRVKPGDFIISLRSFQGGFELTNIEGLISPAYTVFNFIDKYKFNAKYFGYIFKGETFIRKLAGLIYGVRDGKAISFSDFSSMKFKYPSLEEQNRVVKILSNIDLVIKKEKEKLDELRVWKKGLLQQMFV